MLSGESVNISDMMNCRDRRAAIQRIYINKYHCPVLSFTLNIPGPVKTNPQLHQIFVKAMKSIKKILVECNSKTLDSTTFYDKTGDELLLCFDGNAKIIKSKMTLLEESTPLGRLYDIDIIDINGQKLSRGTYRKCLICNCQAQDCARSRKHTIDEMQDKIMKMIKNCQ